MLTCAVALTTSLAGCAQGIPPEALALTPQSFEQRQISSRSYEEVAEAEVLSAAIQVLQDLGFTIDRTAVDAGLVTASKERDATESGQMAAAVAMAVLFGVYMPIDDNQLIRASIVTRPTAEVQTVNVRVAFQRIVTDTQGKTSKIEGLRDPQLYGDFYHNLDQSLFLEAEKV